MVAPHLYKLQLFVQLHIFATSKWYSQDHIFCVDNDTLCCPNSPGSASGIFYEVL